MAIESIANIMRSSVAGVVERLNEHKGNLKKADIMQVSRAMSEEYIAGLRTQAYEDARMGICMSGEYLNMLKKAQWDRCNNANHTEAVSETVTTLNRKSWKPGRYELNISGQFYIVIIRGSKEKVVASLLCKNGESVAVSKKGMGNGELSLRMRRYSSK